LSKLSIWWLGLDIELVRIMTIADSMVASNAQDGIVATTPSGGAPIGVLVASP
jgi:hypothetical protein